MSSRVIQTLLCLLLALAGVHFSSGRTFERKPLTYNGYRLYRVLLELKRGSLLDSVAIAIQNLMRLQRDTDTLILLDSVFWPGKAVHVVVSPHMAPEAELKLEQFGLVWSLLSANYMQIIDKDVKQEAPTSVHDVRYNWISYYTLNHTYNFLNQLQHRDPGVVHRFEIGRSAEGRRIIGVHVSKPDNRRKIRGAENDFQNILNLDAGIGLFTMQRIWESITQTGSRKKVKPTIFIEAGMHGNQWITSAVATYIIKELATSTEPAIAWVAKRYNWLILPHANPDGYVYTDKSDRLWSRTRGKHKYCIGVDPNRNFGFNWVRRDPSSPLPICNKNYRGPEPFSEVEVKALSDAIMRGRNNIQLYIALHFGERRKVKFSYDYENMGKVPNNTLLNEINNGIVDDIENDIVTAHGASSVEWAFQVAGIKNAFNFEIGAGTLIAASVIPGTQVPQTAIRRLAKDTLHELVLLATKLLPIDDAELRPSWEST